MNKKNLLTLVLGILLFSFSNAQKKPNIIVLMSDDIGVGDIGYYHHERTGQTPVVATPNIDKLIQSGIHFTDAHSPASLCAPTRFSMMTGNFIYRNKGYEWGVWKPEIDAGIAPKFTTIAKIAKEGGYSTAFMGKWGLGGLWKEIYKDNSKYEQTDCKNGGEEFGFDYSLILPQGIQNAPFAFYENGKWLKLNPNSKFQEIPFKQTKYDDDNDKGKEGIGDSYWNPQNAGPILANKAVEYISEQSKSDKPFFLYYCSQAVHVPHTPATKMNGTKIAGTTPGKHGDMIKELDAQIGLMVKALKKTGQYENTLFVFTSDNGGLNHDKTMTQAGHDSSNGFTGKKGSIYEGGHRVPFIAVWPGKIKPGTESNVTVVGMDMVATLAAVANVSITDKKIYDSANLLPVFTGQSDKQVHQYLLHQSQSAGGPYYALREGDWKLVMKSKKREDFDHLEVMALYNLAKNVSEENGENFAKKPEYAQKVEAMKAKFIELRRADTPTIY